MKIQEIRGMSDEELQIKLGELQESLINLKVQHATRQLENPFRIRETKRDIARIKTVQQETARQGAAAAAQTANNGEQK